MRIRFNLPIVAMSFLLVARSAFAAPSIYTNEIAFHAALGATPVIIESFESVPSGNATSLIFPAAEVSCSGTSWCPGFFGTSSLMPTDGVKGISYATPDSITFTFSKPVTAFAIDVSDLGTAGATNFYANLSNGYTALFFTSHTAPKFDQRFAGVIDSNPFASITFFGTKANDGIYFDRMQIAAIPEPETYAMLLVGLGLLGIASYRKKQKIFL